MKINKYCIEPESEFKLKSVKTNDTADFNSKEEATGMLLKNVEMMAEMQSRLYAQDKYSLLIIFQAMDTAGKDGAIKHVMSGLNPQATHVHSFKQPSAEELDHDYLWRSSVNLPERGKIGIFNRSYYEEVLVVKVHNLVTSQQLPAEFINDDLWKKRYRQIRDYERYLYENGTVILKFFLHLSKEEQKNRFLQRIDDQSKNWKFSAADLRERQYWDEYQQCYEEAINQTSTKYAPWYVVPADKKWFTRLVISEVIVQKLKELDLEYPQLSAEQEALLKEYRRKLEEETS